MRALLYKKRLQDNIGSQPILQTADGFFTFQASFLCGLYPILMSAAADEAWMNHCILIERS
jgi:hypothetical protein